MKKGEEPRKNEESFEARLSELEQIVAKLESDDVPLEDAISLYEKGMTIHKSCEKILADAKLRIEKLSQASLAQNSSDAAPAK